MIGRVGNGLPFQAIGPCGVSWCRRKSNKGGFGAVRRALEWHPFMAAIPPAFDLRCPHLLRLRFLPPSAAF